MKRIFTLLTCFTILFCACKKSDSTNDTADQSGNFSISGVRDVDLSITSDGRYSFPVAVTPTGSARDTVTLGFELPGGIYADFKPQVGITPFNAVVTISTDFTIAGGTYEGRIKGIGHSGTRSYALNVTIPEYRGWKLGSVIYQKTGLTKDGDSTKQYPNIRVNGPGGQLLVVTFAKTAKLPTKTSTYKIAADSNTLDNVQIAMVDGAHFYRATGYNSLDGTKGVTGTFTFDTLRRFTFRCANVEMTDGNAKLPLNCNFSE